MEQVKQHTLLELMETFHGRMAKFEAQLQSTPTTTNTASLAGEFASFKAFILESLNALQSQINIVAKTVDKLEMNGRRDMLMFHGVPEHENEDTSQLVSKVVVDKLKIDDFAVGDIKTSYRLGRSSYQNKPRPIIVKFHPSGIRDSIWSSKTKLKSTGVTLSEYLTHSRRKVFIAAREKCGINRCWTRNGVILVLGLNNIRHRVTSMEDLQSIDFEPAKTVSSLKTAPKTRRIAATKK